MVRDFAALSAPGLAKRATGRVNVDIDPQETVAKERPAPAMPEPATPSAFVDGVLGGLLPLGPIRARAMFGGWGLFLDDAMFGLIANRRLYFKVDAETEPRFAAAGAAAFTYLRQGKRIAMSYREAPLETPWGAPLEARALLPWAELGLAAAKRALQKRRR